MWLPNRWKENIQTLHYQAAFGKGESFQGDRVEARPTLDTSDPLQKES